MKCNFAQNSGTLLF